MSQNRVKHDLTYKPIVQEEGETPGQGRSCLGVGDLPSPAAPALISAPRLGQAAPWHTGRQREVTEMRSGGKRLHQPQRGAGAWQQQQHFDPVHTSTPQFSHPVLSVETLRHVLLKWRHCTIWIPVSVIQQPQCLVRIGVEKPVDFNWGGSVLSGLQQFSRAMPHKPTHFHVTRTTVQSCVSNPCLPSAGHWTGYTAVPLTLR